MHQGETVIRNFVHKERRENHLRDARLLVLRAGVCSTSLMPLSSPMYVSCRKRDTYAYNKTIYSPGARQSRVSFHRCVGDAPAAPPLSPASASPCLFLPLQRADARLHMKRFRVGRHSIHVPTIIILLIIVVHTYTKFVLFQLVRVARLSIAATTGFVISIKANNKQLTAPRLSASC